MSDTVNAPSPSSSAEPKPAAGSSGGMRHAARGFAREVLLPAAVLIGLLAIAVALIEGPPLQQFLYAVF